MAYRKHRNRAFTPRRNGPFIGGGRILDMDFDDATSVGDEENYGSDERVIAAGREELPIDAPA